MRVHWLVAACLGLVACGADNTPMTPQQVKSNFPSATPTEEGVALAIVYDTSGSMAEEVKTTAGRASKHAIGLRSLESIFSKLQGWAASNPSKKVQIGLYTFDGSDGQALLKMENLDSDSFHRAVQRIGKPDGPTPLGPAIALAGKALLLSPVNHRHMVVITDGEATSGDSPKVVLDGLSSAANGGNPISTYFVAFDVNANVFEAVKPHAAIFSADDESSLNERLGFILNKKILFEDDDTQPTGQR